MSLLDLDGHDIFLRAIPNKNPTLDYVDPNFRAEDPMIEQN